MPSPLICPKCYADLDGGLIPENWRQHYSPPYHWSRAVSIYSREQDRHVEWKCPDCGGTWL